MYIEGFQDIILWRQLTYKWSDVSYIPIQREVRKKRTIVVFKMASNIRGMTPFEQEAILKTMIYFLIYQIVG